MSQSNMTDPQALAGQIARDQQGEAIGEVRGVYYDTQTSDPAWVAVNLGRTGLTLVPLAGATSTGDGLVVAFERARIGAAPYRQPDLPEELSDEEEAALHAYYGTRGGARAPRRRPLAARRPSSPSRAEAAAGAAQQVASAATDEAHDVATTAKEQAGEVASTAKDQVAEVASTARAQGQRVASAVTERSQDLVQSTTDEAKVVAETAKDQAAQVAEVASVQARELLDETKTRLENEAVAQTRRLAENLRQLGEEALALAEGRPDDAPNVCDYVFQTSDRLLDAADRAHAVAGDVEERGFEAVLSDLQRFGRRRPGLFLLGATVVGFAAGRAVRNRPSDEATTGNGSAVAASSRGAVGPPARPTIGRAPARPAR